MCRHKGAFRGRQKHPTLQTWVHSTLVVRPLAPCSCVCSVDGRHHPDSAVSGLGASSSDCFLDVDNFNLADLVASKLYKRGTVIFPEAALEHWHSHTFEAIGGQ